MKSSDKLRLGIVGVGGRGPSFKLACDSIPQVDLVAVCDANPTNLAEAAARLGARETFGSMEEMLTSCSGLDAVIVGTPMPFHVPQTILALKAGLHVMCEVPAGVSIEECRSLTLAVREAKSTYMMAENYIFRRSNMMIRAMVEKGLFGIPYFADGEYIHELKALNEQTPWRKRWQTGINGNTYPTHSIGPILQWMPGDRVTQVCFAGAGHHAKDPAGNGYLQEDSVLTLNRMRSGGLVKLRLDMLSDRPHAMTNYQLQGTDGCYESARSENEPDRIWLRCLGKGPDEWTDLRELEAEHLPAAWRNAPKDILAAGHGGGDYFEILEFVTAAMGGPPPTVGIDAAMDMTLPGLASQESAAAGGAWIDVPDSRTWSADQGNFAQQLIMVWPSSRLDQPPTLKIPDGYTLRPLNRSPEDLDKYSKLMLAAGFDGWSRPRTELALDRALPGAFLVIEQDQTGDLVATAYANHNPSSSMPNAASLEYVAGDPRHRGRGLGFAICAAVTRIVLSRGYRSMFLLTDDWRLPAIATYLRLGFEPHVQSSEMKVRWDAVLAKLKSVR
jgi:predicted dehydrogenase/GNAT superfamily N-acetyltransferase